jgi:outer membrane protein
LEQQSQEVQAEAMQPLFDLIRTALDDIRAEDNYTMILDLSRESSQIVTFDRNLDISDRVLTRIRAAAGARPGAAPGAARTPSPTAPRPAQPGPVAQPSAARRP